MLLIIPVDHIDQFRFSQSNYFLYFCTGNIWRYNSYLKYLIKLGLCAFMKYVDFIKLDTSHVYLKIQMLFFVKTINATARQSRYQHLALVSI